MMHNILMSTGEHACVEKIVTYLSTPCLIHGVYNADFKYRYRGRIPNNWFLKSRVRISGSSWIPDILFLERLDTK